MSEEMLRIAQETTMKKTPEEAFSVVLRGYLKGKMGECEREMRRYEEKYGMSFEDFEKRISDKGFAGELERRHGAIRVEDDYFDWSGAFTDFQYYKGKLEKLDRCH